MANKKSIPASTQVEAPASDPSKKKTVCPVTREQFRKDARPLTVQIDGTPMVADVKEFSTGSLGWNINGKTTLKVGDQVVSVQVGLNLTIVNSKELPQ